MIPFTPPSRVGISKLAVFDSQRVPGAEVGTPFVAGIRRTDFLVDGVLLATEEP